MYTLKSRTLYFPDLSSVLNHDLFNIFITKGLYYKSNTPSFFHYCLNFQVTEIVRPIKENYLSFLSEFDTYPVYLLYNL